MKERLSNIRIVCMWTDMVSLHVRNQSVRTHVCRLALHNVFAA